MDWQRVSCKCDWHAGQLLGGFGRRRGHLGRFDRLRLVGAVRDLHALVGLLAGQQDLLRSVAGGPGELLVRLGDDIRDLDLALLDGEDAPLHQLPVGLFPKDSLAGVLVPKEALRLLDPDVERVSETLGGRRNGDAQSGSQRDTGKNAFHNGILQEEGQFAPC